MMPTADIALNDPQTLYRQWEGDGVDLDTLGASPEQIREFALGGLTRRLEIVGVPLSSL